MGPGEINNYQRTAYQNAANTRTKTEDDKDKTDKTENTGDDNSIITEDKSGLSMEDFYTLLAVQLQNQDMSTPMDNSEMMNQMVQMAMVEAMTTMTAQSATSYAVSLIGKDVQIMNTDFTSEQTTKTGKVVGISMQGSAPIVYLEGDKTPYPMNMIITMGEVPKPDETPDEGEEPEVNPQADAVIRNGKPDVNVVSGKPDYPDEEISAPGER